MAYAFGIGEISSRAAQVSFVYDTTENKKRNSFLSLINNMMLQEYTNDCVSLLIFTNYLA